MSKSNLVKIVGAGHGSEYTSLKRAILLVERGVAAWVADQQAIAFHDHQHFIETKQHTDSKIAGAFDWSVRESAGYQVMQAEHTLKS